MSKAARHRASRAAREERQRAAADSQRDALEAAGYPVESLQQALADGTGVFIACDGFKGGRNIAGKIVKIDVGAGPRVFVAVELDAPEAA